MHVCVHACVCVCVCARQLCVQRVMDVCVCTRVLSQAELDTLWLSQRLLGNMPQGTGAGVPHRTSATRTPRLSHAGGLN